MAPAKQKASGKKGKASPKRRTPRGVKAAPPTDDSVAAVAAAGGVAMKSAPEDDVDARQEIEVPVDYEEEESHSRPLKNPAFNDMLFHALVYRAANGDINVSGKDPEHKALFAWMQEQRQQYKDFQEDPSSSTLTAPQVAVLNSLNFHWHTRGDDHWIRRFEELKQFYEENGHSLVPRAFTNNLGDFVAENRRQYKFLQEGKPSRLTVERKSLLDKIGFVWQVRNRSGWNDRYDELIKFKEEYGDTIVPQVYPPNRPLGKWVAKQREQYRLLQAGKHSFLTPDRLQLLNQIDFVWHAQGPGRYGRLVKAEGDTRRGPGRPSLPRAEAPPAAPEAAAAAHVDTEQINMAQAMEDGAVVDSVEVDVSEGFAVV